uniref:Uncharacterized protein n=1 Tax=Sphaerodactylus townsendi TaxID=933632 RepID=A0ACB8E789_9SAUR
MPDMVELHAGHQCSLELLVLSGVGAAKGTQLWQQEKSGSAALEGQGPAHSHLLLLQPASSAPRKKLGRPGRGQAGRGAVIQGQEDLRGLQGSGRFLVWLIQTS